MALHMPYLIELSFDGSFPLAYKAAALHEENMLCVDYNIRTYETQSVLIKGRDFAFSIYIYSIIDF